MNVPFSEQLIDHIVQQVLKQIGKGSPSGNSTKHEPSLQNTKPNQECILDEKIITEELLAERTSESCVCCVRPDAIVTPAAKDFLREQGIGLQCSTDRVEPNGSASERTFCRGRIIVTSVNSTMRSFMDSVREGSLGWSVTLADNRSSGVSSVFDVLCREGETFAVLFTEEPEAAACEINRNLKCCAAVVSSSEQMKRIRSHQDWNVWVIDPAGKSFYQLKRILDDLSA